MRIGWARIILAFMMLCIAFGGLKPDLTNIAGLTTCQMEQDAGHDGNAILNILGSIAFSMIYSVPSGPSSAIPISVANTTNSASPRTVMELGCQINRPPIFPALLLI